jgi:transcription elongation factor Elf1
MSLITESKYLRLISSRLRNFKQKNTYLWNFSCPMCGDSQKNLSKARGYVFQKDNSLLYRCHNCGVSTNVANLIRNVDASLFKEFVLENFKESTTNFSSTKSASFKLPSPKFDKVEKKSIFEHGEWIINLPSGHFCLEYATKRQIPLKFYDKLLFTSHYKQFCDKLIPNHDKYIIDDARLVIPYYNEYNDLIAISGRALETSDKTLRYVTIRTTDSTEKLVYGMDRVDLSKPVYIVEGPLDSLFIENCVASGDSSLHTTATLVHSRKKILVFDNEPRNKEIVKLMEVAIKLGHFIVIWPDGHAGKDINEMILLGKTESEIKEIIDSNTTYGLEAQLRLNFWKKI